MKSETKTIGLKVIAVALTAALLGTVALFAIGTGALTPTPASAESLSALTLQASLGSDLESPFKAAYESVNESVVGVELTQETYARNGRIASNTAFVGSGVVIDNECVVTNYHVVTANSTVTAEGISVVYQNERYPAELVAGDESSDVAVLKVEGLPAPAAKLGNSDELSVGDWALVIGNPLGEQFLNTLTVGVVSGVNRDVSSSGTTMIQTNAQVNSGNSGGGLFNIRGELVGITSRKMSGFTMGGSSIEGFGFAIPINTVTKIADDLIQYGQVVYPRLGISVRNFPSPSDEPTKDMLPASIWVFGLEEGSPAGEAGIQVDDLITEVDGTRVRTYDDLQKILREHKEGDVVQVTVYRVPDVRNVKGDQDYPDGEFLTLPVTLRILEKTQG